MKTDLGSPDATPVAGRTEVTQCPTAVAKQPDTDWTMDYGGGPAPPEPTPGPWHDDGYRIHAPTESADKRDGRVIVEYKHVEGFNYADAALIASAPETAAERDALRSQLAAALEALEQADAVLETFKADAVCDHSVNICWCEFNRAREAVAAALQRAKGPQP